MDIIGIKHAPGDHKSSFKKVGAIPCGCKQYQLNKKNIYVYISANNMFTDLSKTYLLFPFPIVTTIYKNQT